MILKKLISSAMAFVILLSSFSAFTITASADEEIPVISCVQSAGYTKTGDSISFILNTQDKETPEKVYWNTISGDWKGVAVLEFMLPAMDADKIKSAELTYTVHNGSSRSGGRTYDIYASDITIDSALTYETLKAMSLGNSMYAGAAVLQGATRTDTATGTLIRDYVKGKASAESETKIQFAFSNSSQALDIDPTTAELKIVMYGGGIALEVHEKTILTSTAPTKLAVGIFQEGIEEADLVWESSDSSVVSVDSGVITPHKTGTALITVKTADESFADECMVTVQQAAEGISFDKNDISLMAGCTADELNVRFTPENAVNRDVEWTSGNEAVAKVSQNGIITPVSVGEATITATVKDTDIKAECTVKVTEMIEPESISLDKETLSLPKLGATAPIKADILPANADNRITWTSSNTEVAQVLDGVVVAGEVGEAVITATTSNGKTAQCSVTITDDKSLITNDYFYKDTNGNPIFSQGGGIFKFGDTYYWYGVRYKDSMTYVENPLETKNVEHPAMDAYTCYTSKDLVNWKYEGDVANLQTLGADWNVWAGRCGVVYNENAKKYVLVSQFDGEIIASSDSPLGPFTRVTHYFWGSLPSIANNQTGDLTMFYDDDGGAYMICSSANGRGHLYVVPMSKEDYCSFDFDNMKELPGTTSQYFDEDGTIKKKDKGGIEGDCMFRYKDHYYFTGSDLYGWHGSRAYVFESDSILGDYNLKPDYVPESDRSKNISYIMPGVKNNYAHNSQTGFYYTLKGTKQDLVIYCGDRWSSFCSNGIGFNQWNPLTMDGYTPHFNNLSQWRLNSVTGEWSVGDGNNYIANPTFDADRVDLNKLTGWESGDNVGGTATGNVKDKRVSGKYSARHSGNTDYIATTKQTVAELPDGTYTLRASVKSSGGQNECKLYIKIGDKEYKKSLKSAMSGWTDVVISNVEIKNGECEVGLYSDANAGNYVRIDDMYLTRDYDGTFIEGKMNTNVPGASKVSVELVDGAGRVISKLASGAEVFAKATYENNSAVSKVCRVYIAVYKSGVLKSIQSAEFEVDADSMETVTTDKLVLPDNNDDVSVKLFLWDDEMQPLTRSVDIN